MRCQGAETFWTTEKRWLHGNGHALRLPDEPTVGRGHHEEKVAISLAPNESRPSLTPLLD